MIFKVIPEDRGDTSLQNGDNHLQDYNSQWHEFGMLNWCSLSITQMIFVIFNTNFSYGSYKFPVLLHCTDNTSCLQYCAFFLLMYVFYDFNLISTYKDQ
jgi:hypothetical protein